VVRRTVYSSECALTNSQHNRENKFLGDLSDVGTPGNIPNPVVKHVSADGTWGATSWESRSLPRNFFLLTIKIGRHVLRR
jgi:hypothetical protein